MRRALALVPLVIVLGVACRGHERRRAVGPGTVVSESAAPFRLPVGDTAGALDSARGASAAGAVAGATTSAAAAGSTATPASPLAIVAADSAAGDSLYHGRGRCFTCHGPLGAGIANLGTSLRGPTWLHGDGSLSAILATIRDGVASPVTAPVAMPAYRSLLTPRQAYQLAAYVWTLSHPGSTIPDSLARQASPAAPPPPASPPPAPPPSAPPSPQ